MQNSESFTQASACFFRGSASRLMLAAAVWTAIVPAARAADTALADLPISASQEAVPANVMLALSVEFPTALSHANFSQGNTAGVAALPADSTADPYFETTRKYLGYFESKFCYTFDEAGKYFKYAGPSNEVDFSCPKQWSGNYLNWATMQVSDLFRWAMTGGARDIDEPLDFSAASPVGKTVLVKGWSNDQGQDKNFPNKVISSTLIPKYTALDGSDTNNLVAVVLHKGIDVEFSYSSDNSPGSTVVKKLPVRVLVCDGTDTSKHEYQDNFYCQKYQNADKDKIVYKPVGLMQKNINKMRFGAVSYLNLNNSTYGDDEKLKAWDGGVIKAQIRDTKQEIYETGAFPSNPFPADKGGDTSVELTGAINYLNLFGYKARSFKRYDNVSEMYAVGLRYLLGPSGIGNVAAFSNMPAGVTATQIANIKDNFPVITKWDDPMFSALNGGLCQKQFIIGIGDTNNCCDYNLSGGEPPINAAVSGERFAGETARAWVTKLPSYNENSDYIAGLAYAANTKPLRSDFPKMRIKTFWVDALEYSVKAENNQYEKAAKYGAFNDTNGNGVPDDGEWNALGEKYKGVAIPDAYFPASDPDRLLSGLSSAFSQINSLIAAGAGAGLTSSSISETLTADATYQTRYDSQYWSGDLRGMKIDSINIATGVISTTMKWSAAAKLDTLVAGAGWDTARNVVTLKPNDSGTLIGAPFRLASLSAAQKTALGSTETEQGNVLNYLRGDTSKESTLSVRKTFRYRASVLGDIVDSAATYVGPPSEVYADAFNPGYSTFKAAKATRKPVVYVGANDGMLHAFDARVDSTDGGKELFALVPNAVFNGPDNQPSISGLKALTDNGYLHRYYVNGTPFVRDVDFNRAGTSATPADSDWRSLLVVGLGKGGRSYVAVDVTDPSSFTSETNVAGKVLWEFTHEDMGFSYGRPFIVKTPKWGWVVVIAAGYNNTLGTSTGSSPGKGVIFVLNPKDGTLLQKVKTAQGTAATPAGLAHISGYVPDYSDMKMDQLYAGDLLGNLWRFDFTSATATVPDLSTPIAKLETATGTAQPVTTEPLVEIASDLTRYVFVGTGRLLHNDDRNNTQTQTFYALRDGTVTNPYTTEEGKANQLPTGVDFPVKREKMVQVTSLIEGVTLAGDKPMGWYYDLTGRSGTAAEQVIINPQANEGLVSWVGTLMNQDKCNPAGESSTYAVKYGTAKSAFAKTEGNARVPIEFISSSSGLVGLRLVRYGSAIRLMGSFSAAESGPAFIGSQVGGIGDPRVLNWRIIGQ